MTCLGIDGCRAGWVGVYRGNAGLQALVSPTLVELLAAVPDTAAVFVDMPIGLPHAGVPSRACDAAAREFLRGRASSVFSPPGRGALRAGNHLEANKLNQLEVGKGLSIQAFNIGPKIRELDDLLRSSTHWQSRMVESHPEVCFMALNGMRPLQHAKATAAGQEERLGLLERHVPEIRTALAGWLNQWLRREVKADDLLDAMMLWLAASRPETERRMLPTRGADSSRPYPPCDAVGLPMQVVYWGDGA